MNFQELNSTMKLSIKQKVASDLALRDSANRFFDQLEKTPSKSITVSFTGIKSISRSFAHQYLARKADSTKEILESDVPEVVSKMFAVVQRPGKKYELPKLSVRRLSSVDAAFS